MRYLTWFLIGYLLGSIPTAYIFVKVFNGIDIRKAGSGNVGALNAYEVSGSPLIGLSVLLIDVMKGYFAFKLSENLSDGDAVACLIAGVSAVLGHNFSIWINFYGGRGLATSLGVFLALNPILILIWCLLWFVAFLKFKLIHAGNIWATVSTPIAILPFLKFLNSFSFTKIEDAKFLAFILAISFLIFIKHLKPFFQLVHLTKEGSSLKNKKLER
jgi:glycerol-3-phosphate acyltransferase PlsY